MNQIDRSTLLRVAVDFESDQSWSKLLVQGGQAFDKIFGPSIRGQSKVELEVQRKERELVM